MATLEQLNDLGAITLIEAVEGSPVRLMYASPRVLEWLDGPLIEMKSDRNLEISPLEQTFTLIEDFCAGRPLCVGPSLNQLDRLRGDRGLWKLKTNDVRIFGWFPARDVFVAVSGHSATFVKQHGLYQGLAREVEHFRECLDLDEPKAIIGDAHDGVVSNYYFP